MIRRSSNQFSERLGASGRLGGLGVAALAMFAAWLGAGACLAPDAQQGIAAGSSTSSSGGLSGGPGGSGNQGGGGSGQGGGGGGVGGGGGGSSPTGVSLEWVKPFGNGSSQSAQAVAADASGGAVVAGIFFYESLETDSVTLANSGGMDIFVTRLASDGSVSWSRSFGGTGEQFVRAAAVDPKDGSIVVAGGFTLNLSANECGEMLAPSGVSDIFVMKLSPIDGACMWGKSFGDDWSQSAVSLAIGADQSIVIGGTFLGTIDFGMPTVPLTIVDDPALSDSTEIFLAKLDAAGQPLLARSLGDASFNPAQATVGVAVDAANDILVTGSFEGALHASPAVVVNEGSPDLFIIKLTGADASPVWSLTSGDMTNAQNGHHVVADASNNVIVTGYFSGPLTLGGEPLATASDTDLFVASIAPDGALQWVKHVGGVGAQYGLSLALDGDGAILLGGGFSGVLDFGEGGTLIGSDVMAGMPLDAYVAKLTPKGELVWSFQGSGPESQLFQSVAPASTGGVFAAGWFQGSSTFGGPPIASKGSEDIVVLKLSD